MLLEDMYEEIDDSVRGETGVQILLLFPCEIKKMRNEWQNPTLHSAQRLARNRKLKIIHLLIMEPNSQPHNSIN